MIGPAQSAVERGPSVARLRVVRRAQQRSYGGARLAVAVALAVAAQGCSGLLYLVMRVRPSPLHRRIALAQEVTGHTGRPDGLFDPPCGGPRSGSSDHAWVFVAPATGRYRVVLGGQHDVVLAVYDGADESTVLGCNDDAVNGNNTDAELELTLRQGRRYVLVADGFRGAQGHYALRVDARPTGDFAAPSLDGSVGASPSDASAER